MADEARVIDGRLYTIRRVYDSRLYVCRIKWALYCDGERVGFFKTKPEAWSMANALRLCARNEQAIASIEAEQRGCVEGAAVLDLMRRMAAGVAGRKRE